MKTLLYITVNSKPEHLSASKTVGRTFVEEFKKTHKDVTIKELDLYQIEIPKLKYQYFKNRNTIVDVNQSKDLSTEEVKEVERIIELAKEFKEADYYVIVAPMWSLLFPSPLKEYIDCVVQNDITIKVSPDKVTGLLNDKERKMVYIQSSGGPIPWLLDTKMNHGGNYIKDLFKFVGIKEYYEILVDHTGFTEEEERKAVESGQKEAIVLAKKL